MEQHDTETRREDWGSNFLQRAFIGTCTIIIGLVGTLAGVWGGHMEQQFKEFRDGQHAIWTVLNDRASLPTRTIELEKRADDQEQRLREIERGRIRR